MAPREDVDFIWPARVKGYESREGLIFRNDPASVTPLLLKNVAE
jgi:hypothetical protein